VAVLKAQLHYSILAVMAAGGVFFVSSGYRLGWTCGAIIGGPFACGPVVDYPFLSIGILFVILAAVESLMALQRKKTGSPVWETDSQKRIRRVGMLMLLVGAIGGAFGLYEVNNTLVSCTPLSCGAGQVLRIWGVYYISLYASACVAAIGGAFVLAAAFMGVKPEKWRDRMIVPSRV
jgi:hypothetical protein